MRAELRGELLFCLCQICHYLSNLRRPAASFLILIPMKIVEALKDSVKPLKIYLNTQYLLLFIGYYWCNNALLISFLSPPYFITIARYFGYDSPMGLHFLYWLPFDPYQPVYYEITLVLQTWHGKLLFR